LQQQFFKIFQNSDNMGPVLQTFFTLGIKDTVEQASVQVTLNHFHPILIFVGKVGSNPSGALNGIAL